MKKLFIIVMLLPVLLFGQIDSTKWTYQGPTSPKSVRDSMILNGTLPWDDIDNVLTLWDGSNAWGQDDSNVDSDTMQYLIVDHMGFNVPDSSIITGVRVYVLMRGSDRNPEEGHPNLFVTNVGAYLVKPDFSLSAGNLADSTAYFEPLMQTEVYYGADTTLWGESWTPSMINDTAFGFALGTYLHCTYDPEFFGWICPTVAVESILMSVYYIPYGYLRRNQ